LQPGDRVLHVGCGLGYYTALIAACVGESGRVLAFDVDNDLATEARANLAAYPQVDVRSGNGIDLPAGEAVVSFDAILINAGMSHPHDAWLAALKPGGRMVVPLTVPFPPMGATIGKGIVVLIQGDQLNARLIAFVAIYSALGIRGAALTEALGKAMARNPFPSIKRLRRDAHEAGAACWMHSERLCLSLD
jgi:protein-L-isoaspartate(D-aspartate) O-methyltransferase